MSHELIPKANPEGTDYQIFINFDNNEVHFVSTKKMNAIIRVYMATIPPLPTMDCNKVILYYKTMILYT